MKFGLRTRTSLRRELAVLEREVEHLAAERDRLILDLAEASRATRRHASAVPLASRDLRLASGDNVYVLDDDDDEARAFDDFYRAYDEVHAKTRKFLLG